MSNNEKFFISAHTHTHTHTHTQMWFGCITIHPYVVSYKKKLNYMGKSKQQSYFNSIPERFVLKHDHLPLHSDKPWKNHLQISHWCIRFFFLSSFSFAASSQITYQISKHKSSSKFTYSPYHTHKNYLDFWHLKVLGKSAGG